MQSKVSSPKLVGKCRLVKMNQEGSLEMEEKSQMDNTGAGMQRTVVGPLLPHSLHRRSSILGAECCQHWPSGRTEIKGGTKGLPGSGQLVLEL